MEVKELEVKREALKVEVKTFFDSITKEDGTFEATEKVKLDEVAVKNREIEDLEKQIFEAKSKVVIRPEFPIAEKKEAKNMEVKTLGDVFIDAGKKSGNYPVEFKTLFTRAAGMAPERHRNGHVDLARTNTLTIWDVFDVEPISTDAIVFERETIPTGALEVAEGGSFNEAQIAYTDVTVIARKVTIILPVTDEVLADNPRLQARLDGRLSDQLRQRFDTQFYVGLGTGVLMTGLTETSSTLSYTRVTGESIGDAMIAGASKIREGKAGVANVFLMNPVDYTKMRLLKGSDGHYVYADLRDAVTPNLDGVPVVLVDAIPANKVLAVDRAHVKIGLRSDVEMEVGYNGTDFGEGKKSIRGQMRGNSLVYRPQAIVEIDITTPA